jgi:transposase
VLRAALADVIEDASNEPSAMTRRVVPRAFEHWRELDEHMRWCDQQVGQHVRSSEAAKRAAKITGIGELGASALTAGVGDFKQFKSGDQFGAWLGIVPRQNSTGGKASLGRITKRGDDYLRTLLIQGAKAAVMSASKRDVPDLALAGAVHRSGGLAESLRDNSQQERPNPVGGDDQRSRLRPSSRQRQANGQAAGTTQHGARYARLRMLRGLTRAQFDQPENHD